MTKRKIDASLFGTMTVALALAASAGACALIALGFGLHEEAGELARAAAILAGVGALAAVAQIMVWLVVDPPKDERRP